MMKKVYGYELVRDFRGCDKSVITSKNKPWSGEGF